MSNSQTLQELKMELRRLSDRLLHSLANPKNSYEDFHATLQKVELLEKRIDELENL